MLTLSRKIGCQWHQTLRLPLTSSQQHRTVVMESPFERKERHRGTIRYLKRKNPILPPQDEGFTFQFVGEEGEKSAASRIYVWGNAQYGALGQSTFLMPRKIKQNIISQMFKPYR
jgi:hypothetical protein